jgi:hypothetical protein
MAQFALPSNDKLLPAKPLPMNLIKVLKESCRPFKLGHLGDNRPLSARQRWFSMLSGGAFAIITCSVSAQTLPSVYTDATVHAPNFTVPSGHAGYGFPIQEGSTVITGIGSYYTYFNQVPSASPGWWVADPGLTSVTTQAGAPANAAGSIIGGGYAPSAEVWYNGVPETNSLSGSLGGFAVGSTQEYSSAVIVLVPFELAGPASEQVTVDFAGNVSNDFNGNANIGQGYTAIANSGGGALDEISTLSGNDNIIFSEVDQLTTDTLYYLQIYANVGTGYSGASDFGYISIDPTVTIDPTFLANNPDVTLVSDPGFLTQSIPEPSTYAAIIGVTSLGLAMIRRRRFAR